MSQAGRYISGSSTPVDSVTGGANIVITGTASNPVVNVGLTTNHSVQVGNGALGLTQIPIGTTGQVLTGVTGSDPVFAAPAASSISITGDAGGALTGSAFTLTASAIGLSFNGAGTTETLGGTLIVANGGTGAISETNHGVLLGRGTAPIGATAVGASNTVLLGNTAADPGFGAVPNAALVNDSVTLNNGNNITVTGGSPLVLGGKASFNVTGTITNSVQIGNAGGSLSSLTAGTSGQVLSGVTASAPIFTATPMVTSISFDGVNNLSSYVADTAWTPVLAFGGASVGITYATQIGRYTKIGNLVVFTANISTSSIGSSTGAATINGLTITPDQATTYSITFSHLTYTGQVMAFTSAGSNIINLDQQLSGAGITALTNTNFAATTLIYVSGCYTTTT